MTKEHLDKLKRYFFTEDKQIKVVSVDSEFVDELGIKTAGFVRFEDVKELLKTHYIPKSRIDNLIVNLDNTYIEWYIDTHCNRVFWDKVVDKEAHNKSNEHLCEWMTNNLYNRTFLYNYLPIFEELKKLRDE